MKGLVRHGLQGLGPDPRDQAYLVNMASIGLLFGLIQALNIGPQLAYLRQSVLCHSKFILVS